MSAFLLPNDGGGQEPDRVRHSRLVITYSRIFLWIKIKGGTWPVSMYRTICYSAVIWKSLFIQGEILILAIQDPDKFYIILLHYCPSYLSILFVYPIFLSYLSILFVYTICLSYLSILSLCKLARLEESDLRSVKRSLLARLCRYHTTHQNNNTSSQNSLQLDGSRLR